MFDLLFSHVKMYDGSGKDAGKLCDVAVSGDKIAAVGKIPATAAQNVIDGTGLTMIPGMIDVHTHSDFTLFRRPGREEALLQGITTEIISACGIGSVPLSGRERGEYLGLMGGIFGEIPAQVDTGSMDAFFRSLPPTGLNVAAQVGHSPLRTAALGTTADVPFTKEAAERMERLERQAFEEGAVSVSTGMSYFPAAFCDYAELLGLAKVAAEYDAPMSVHRRDEFRHPMPGFDSREEVLSLARDSGAKLVFSHFRTGAGSAGSAAKLYNLRNRGEIREGYYADLCVFDEKTVQPRSTYRDPKQYAEGVKYVTVNGTLAVSEGKITGARPGRPLRRGK